MKTFVSFRPGKNIKTIKTCKTCKYYIAAKERCELFGNMDVVNGEIEYNFAVHERSESGNCNPEARYWSPIPPIENQCGDSICPIPTTPVILP